ncbi:hypothetical protein phi1422_0033 [Bdellovibrio phage phi1422]|uniref:hypothetical protein n=1 Tax=Bdellovibrio phage phi1422 TaxID=1127515 RepID=UPI0002536D55|nr:hypothetical protein F395_gp33 [Bdellovibrio phage phi1422]AFC22553.1 hypothetical protein phi1422_0033 [Bdellovibrio phage phi1422]
MANSVFYCIDLDSRRPEVLEYSGKALNDDMAFFKAKTVKDLDNFDRRVFACDDEADKFLENYSQVMNSLDNKKICKDRTLPAMLYKRRYIVQTLMGEKFQTYRSYRKDWRPGQLFNLHDQTFFLTVRLKSITETEHGFCYKFELP